MALFILVKARYERQCLNGTLFKNIYLFNQPSPKQVSFRCVKMPFPQKVDQLVESDGNKKKHQQFWRA